MAYRLQQIVMKMMSGGRKARRKHTRTVDGHTKLKRAEACVRHIELVFGLKPPTEDCSAGPEHGAAAGGGGEREDFDEDGDAAQPRTIAELDHEIENLDECLSVARQSTAVLERKRHYAQRQRLAAEPIGLERELRLQKHDRQLDPLADRAAAGIAEGDGDGDGDGNANHSRAAGRCLHCGDNSVWHQANTCPWQWALSIDQSIELVYKRGMSKSTYSELREMGVPVGSYNDFMRRVKRGLEHPPEGAHRHVAGKGDSVLGSMEKMLQWHMDLPDVRLAMLDEADSERAAGSTFCISFDGSDNFEIMVARNALLRRSAGDVSGIIPVSVMRSGETRGELLEFLGLHDLPNELNGQPVNYVFHPGPPPPPS